ncbi:MAG: phosphonate metabolism transcriptional regulator PhnF [Pseudomonadota bacterium]
MTISEEDAPLWRQVERAIAAEIAAGRYIAGAKLPTEAEFAGRHGVNRHTVRRALAALREAGVVRSRRGAGVFVTETPPLAYTIGPTTRFTRSLEEAGRIGDREILRLETLPATLEDAERLGVRPGDAVHLYEGVALADGTPLALAHSVFPAARAPGFCEALRETRSITAALAACGIADYRRRSTRLTAEGARGGVARHLRLTVGAPVLRTISMNVTPDGEVIEAGRTWFAADRVELVVDEE